MNAIKNKFTWFLPAHFMVNNGGDEEFEFDLTEYLNILVHNKFWERNITFEKHFFFDQNSLKKIKSIKIKLYPYSNVQFNVDQIASSIFKKEFPNVSHDFQYIIERGNLRTAKSLSIIQIEFEHDQNIPPNLKYSQEFTAERYSNIDHDFHLILLELISVSNEMISLFLTALHLTFPTRYYSSESFIPQTSGLVVISQSDTSYYRDVHSDILTHPILIEAGKFDQLNKGMKVLSSIWHKDLWTLHRLLKGLRTYNLTIDNLLDLVFTLESLFPNNTSSDMMRLASAIMVGKSKGDAKKIDLTLRIVFSIRNEIAHGGKHYRLMDYYKLGKDKYLIMELFFDFKFIVIMLVIHAISKLSPSDEQNKLSIVADDLYELFYKPTPKARPTK